MAREINRSTIDPRGRDITRQFKRMAARHDDRGALEWLDRPVARRNTRDRARVRSHRAQRRFWIESERRSGRRVVREIFRVFAKIGITSFGGGLVAYLRDALVTDKKWMDEEEFLAALEIGQTLPGLNSENVAIIAGRKLAGPQGAVAAALGLILPGVLLLLVLGILYDRFRHNPNVAAALAGVAAAAVGLLLQVTLKIGAKQFLNLRDLCFVLGTFYLVAFHHVSLPVVLFLIAPIAVILCRPKPAKPNP
jgi:chromate transporter